MAVSQVRADPTEHRDLAAAMPAVVDAMNARLDALALTFFDNRELGVDACPPGATTADPPEAGGKQGAVPVPCACWMAVHRWGGVLGPYQEV